MTDVLGGHVQLSFPSMTAALPHVKSGKLKALGMTGLQRSPLAPDVATVSESGVAGYQANIWNGVLVPAATPKAVVTKLNAEFVRVLTSPETRERFAAAGADIVHGTPEEFAAFVKTEMTKWVTWCANPACAPSLNARARGCAAVDSGRRRVTTPHLLLLRQQTEHPRSQSVFVRSEPCPPHWYANSGNPWCSWFVILRLAWISSRMGCASLSNLVKLEFTVDQS